MWQTKFTFTDGSTGYSVLQWREKIHNSMKFYLLSYKYEIQAILEEFTKREEP